LTDRCVITVRVNIAIEYKKEPSKRDRLWLNLPSEERPILDQALKLAR
jgi:hypothetical protein